MSDPGKLPPVRSVTFNNETKTIKSHPIVIKSEQGLGAKTVKTFPTTPTSGLTPTIPLQRSLPAVPRSASVKSVSKTGSITGGHKSTTSGQSQSQSHSTTGGGIGLYPASKSQTVGEVRRSLPQENIQQPPPHQYEPAEPDFCSWLWTKLTKHYSPANITCLWLILTEFIVLIWEIVILVTSVYTDRIPYMMLGSHLVALLSLILAVYFIVRRRWKRVVYSDLVLLVAVGLGGYDLSKQMASFYSKLQASAGVMRLIALIAAFIVIFYSAMNIYIRINEYLVKYEKLLAAGIAAREAEKEDSIMQAARGARRGRKSNKEKSKKVSRSKSKRKSRSGSKRGRPPGAGNKDVGSRLVPV